MFVGRQSAISPVGPDPSSSMLSRMLHEGKELTPATHSGRTSRFFGSSQFPRRAEIDSGRQHTRRRKPNQQPTEPSGHELGTTSRNSSAGRVHPGTGDQRDPSWRSLSAFREVFRDRGQGDPEVALRCTNHRPPRRGRSQDRAQIHCRRAGGRFAPPRQGGQAHQRAYRLSRRGGQGRSATGRRPQCWRQLLDDNKGFNQSKLEGGDQGEEKLKLTKTTTLLHRRTGEKIPYRTLHRFCVAELNYNKQDARFASTTAIRFRVAGRLRTHGYVARSCRGPLAAAVGAHLHRGSQVLNRL